MSDNRTAAIDAATLAMWGQPAEVTHLAGLAYQAIEPIVRQDERERICQREGHQRIDTTSLGSRERQIRCARCGTSWTEPRDTTPCPAGHVGEASRISGTDDRPLRRCGTCRRMWTPKEPT